jgi:RNA polymerase sigma factor (sigma-70 family)
MNALALSSTDGQGTASESRNGRMARRNPSADTHERFKKVVLPYLSDAHALARWLTRSSADSEDVVQEACVHAYRGIANFVEGNARAWVLTIVRHAAFSWLQKNRAVSLLPADDLEDVESKRVSEQNLETPETALMAQDDATRLQASIDALPALFRKTLLLRDMEGLKYRQIAEMTGVSIGTVMSRLARARGRVITDMRAAGGDESPTLTRSPAKPPTRIGVMLPPDHYRAGDGSELGKTSTSTAACHNGGTIHPRMIGTVTVE